MTTLPCFISRYGEWRCTHCGLKFGASHLPPLEKALAACPHNPHARTSKATLRDISVPMSTTRAEAQSASALPSGSETT